MIFSTKVLLSKTNVMQEKSARQKKRQNSGMLRGLGCFLGIKWAVAVPIFTLFNFFPLQTYFYAKSHLLSMLKSKKSDRWRKKCDQSTPALILLITMIPLIVSICFEVCSTFLFFSQGNVPFSKEIVHGCFYYMDKFLILVSGQSFFMYKYHLDTDKVDDIKRWAGEKRFFFFCCFLGHCAPINCIP